VGDPDLGMLCNNNKDLHMLYNKDLHVIYNEDLHILNKKDLHKLYKKDLHKLYKKDLHKLYMKSLHTETLLSYPCEKLRLVLSLNQHGHQFIPNYPTLPTVIWLNFGFQIFDFSIYTCG
jgi:hypothetical protein